MGWVSRFEAFSGQDVDDVFAYYTPKLVKIRDRRVGCIRCFVVAAVFAYVVLYQIIYNYGALVIEVPQGRVRFSLRAPTTRFACDPVEDLDCGLAFSALDNISYCLQNHHTLFPCKIWQYPTTDGVRCAMKRICVQRDSSEITQFGTTSIFVPTHNEAFLQSNLCTDRTEPCPEGILWKTIEAAPNEYIFESNFEGVENFTLLIDHAVSGASSGLGDVSTNMKGRVKLDGHSSLCKRLLADPNNTYSVKLSNGYCFLEDPSRPEADGHDVLPIWMWLAAGGITLDDPNEFNVNESIRGRGMVVRVNIHYTNLKRWIGSTNRIEYEYTITSNPQDKYRVDSTVDIFNDGYNLTRRIINKDYGLRFEVIQGGKLGEFDFNTFILQFAAGSAMLGIAALVTDYIALWLLPEKAQYRAAKVQITDDFSDLRERQKHGHEENGSRFTQKAESSFEIKQT